MNDIILEGFMGSGKSAIGRIIAKALNLPLVDVDKKVSGKLGMKPVEVYDRFGDAYYRAMETVALYDMVEEGKPAVVVLGSGLALMEQNDAYLKSLGKVYYLKISAQQAVARISKNDKHSWLQDDDLAEHVLKMMKEREPAYTRIADMTIPTEGKTNEEIANLIIEAHQKQDA